MITSSVIQIDRLTHEVAARLLACDRISTFTESGWFYAYGWTGDVVMVRAHANDRAEYERLTQPGHSTYARAGFGATAPP